MSTNKANTPVIAANSVNHHQAYEYNRRWLFIDENNNAITDNNKLQQINVDIKFGYLVLQAPGMMRLDIPLDVIEDGDEFETVTVNDNQLTAVDEGEVAAVWATTFLDQQAKLVKVYPLDQNY